MLRCFHYNKHVKEKTVYITHRTWIQLYCVYTNQGELFIVFFFFLVNFTDFHNPSIVYILLLNTIIIETYSLFIFYCPYVYATFITRLLAVTNVLKSFKNKFHINYIRWINYAANIPKKKYTHNTTALI